MYHYNENVYEFRGLMSLHMTFAQSLHAIHICMKNSKSESDNKILKIFECNNSFVLWIFIFNVFYVTKQQK